MNEEIKDRSQIRKCPLCGKEYLKPQRNCPKCDILLMRLSEYERLGMESNRANFQQTVEEQEKIRNQPNIPKCPTCQSSDIQKLSTTSKVIGVRLLGLASKTVGKTYKCNKCGYYW